MTKNIKDNSDLNLSFRGTGRIFTYCLHLADNALILAQRNSEWCAHGPVLEQDIAITNISLDLLGQARNFYQYAASLYASFSNKEKEETDSYLPVLWKQYNRALTEDDLAFLRDEHQYLNIQITELANGDWAQTILRQFFFSSYQNLLYAELRNSEDKQLAAIAQKSLKEVTYHVRWSSEWVIRLGDGTEESRSRIENALKNLWPYTGEMFVSAEYEPIDVSLLRNAWLEKIEQVFSKATLILPSLELKEKPLGKKGEHTDYLNGLLSEMQYLQRKYPNAAW